jgi:hypothetical protein
MTFTDLVAYFRARFGVEDGQTMAEYGVVLAVITASSSQHCSRFRAPSRPALNTVKGYL